MKNLTTWTAITLAAGLVAYMTIQAVLWCWAPPSPLEILSLSMAC